MERRRLKNCHYRRDTNDVKFRLSVVGVEISTPRISAVLCVSAVYSFARKFTAKTQRTPRHAEKIPTYDTALSGTIVSAILMLHARHSTEAKWANEIIGWIEE